MNSPGWSIQRTLTLAYGLTVVPHRPQRQNDRSTGTLPVVVFCLTCFCIFDLHLAHYHQTLPTQYLGLTMYVPLDSRSVGICPKTTVEMDLLHEAVSFKSPSAKPFYIKSSSRVHQPSIHYTDAGSIIRAHRSNFLPEIRMCAFLTDLL